MSSWLRRSAPSLARHRVSRAAIDDVCLLAPLLLACVLTGCYSTTAICADQLPVLNGSFAVTTGRHQVGERTVTTGEVTVAHVAAPDGRMVEITGRFDAILVPRDPANAPIEFEHPVQADLNNGLLRVSGGNRPPVTVSLDAVSHVDVQQTDTATFTWLVIAGVGVAAVIGVAVALTSLSSSSPR